MSGITDHERETILHYIKEWNERPTKPQINKNNIRGNIKQGVHIPKNVKRSSLKASHIPSMKVMYTNADQLTSSKKTELLKNIEREKPLIVAVCEVKPKMSKDRNLLDYNIPGFSLHPTNIDDDLDNGRGIAVYTHESIEKSVVQIKPTVKFEEVCLLEFKLRGGDKLLFGCFYRSPTPSDLSDKNNEDLNSLLKSISNKKYSHVCFVGDFNFKDINWSNCTTVHSEISKESRFIETVRDCYLTQHIERPTRRRGNDNASLLDLVLTNESMQISDISHLAPLGKSDHCVLAFNYHCYLDYARPKTTFSYDKANFQAMRDTLKKENWLANFLVNHQESDDIEHIWADLKSRMFDLKEKFVPKITSSDKPSWKKKNAVPIGKPLQKAIREKQSLHRKWMSSKNGPLSKISRQNYTNCRNKVKRMMRQAKKRYEKDICIKSKQNPKKFWAHIRQVLKTKSGVAPLLENNLDKDSTRFTDKEKADILQKQFSSVFTDEPNSTIPSLDKKTDVLIENLVITIEMVLTKLKQLKINKSCGPDEIHPRILLELCDFLSAPLAMIFNKTLEQGKMPTDWKNAYISPIFKKGAKNRADNYRPISLTSVVCKIMESLVKDTVMSHFITNNLLSPNQYGFVSGRSTVTQLLSYLDKCVEIMSDNCIADAIYLDFAKAFDTVPHERLLLKLQAYGLGGHLLQWIRAFLTNRSQIVKVNGEESFPAPVKSGIPQGSVLGPILFVIYINDLPDALKGNIFLFADDTKILRCITSENDSISLQQDIDKLESWSKAWLLSFNTEKCHVLSLGRIENTQHTHRYKLYDEELEHVFTEKDLGVIFDAELKFEEHISAKVNKANAIAGLIRRSFSFLDKDLFKRLYTTFVRPHLEYAQAVWSPYSRKLIDMLENVQKRATEMVDGLGGLTYEERLRKLDLPTLVYRRARGDMIEVYKHIHVYDKETIPDTFKLQHYRNRRHNYQLLWRKANDGIRGPQSNSFYYRVAKPWNSLPQSVVNANTINGFKNALDDAWADKPFKYEPKPRSDS